MNAKETVVAVQRALEYQPDGSGETGQAYRSEFSVPIILFPSNSHAICSEADALIFPMLMNSRSKRYLISGPVRLARAAYEHGLRTLATAYLVCWPGGIAGRIGHATPIAPTDVTSVVDYTLAAKCLGLSLVYLEAGSGATFPVAPQLISAAKTASGLTVMVGGGVRRPEDAIRAVRAGADWVVTGSLAETISSTTELEERLRDIVSAMTEVPR